MPSQKSAMQALDAEAAARAARGSLLFHLALAEALAGDALAGRPAPEAVGGWALDVGSDGYEVVAVGLGEACDVLARVTFAADGAPIVEASPGAAASPRQLALARAREAAAAHGASLGGRWLALPLPPRQGEPLPPALEAWLIRLLDRPQDLVAGPHWRLMVSAEGRVLEGEPACRAERVVPHVGSGATAGIVLEHEVGDTPSEAHVLLSLRHGVALEVRTPASGLRWRVDGETVRRIAPEPQRRA